MQYLHLHTCTWSSTFNENYHQEGNWLRFLVNIWHSPRNRRPLLDQGVCKPDAQNVCVLEPIIITGANLTDYSHEIASHYIIET